MKPRSIVIFQRLLLTFSLLTILNIVGHYSALRALALHKGASPAGPLLGILVAAGFYGLFRIAIGGRASNIGKWLFVVVTAVALITVPINFPETMAIGLSYAALDGFSFLLQLAAVAVLFRRDASAWLTGQSTTEVGQNV